MARLPPSVPLGGESVVAVASVHSTRQIGVAGRHTASPTASVSRRGRRRWRAQPARRRHTFGLVREQVALGTKVAVRAMASTSRSPCGPPASTAADRLTALALPFGRGRFFVLRYRQPTPERTAISDRRGRVGTEVLGRGQGGVSA